VIAGLHISARQLTSRNDPAPFGSRYGDVARRPSDARIVLGAVQVHGAVTVRVGAKSIRTVPVVDPHKAQHVTRFTLQTEILVLFGR